MHDGLRTAGDIPSRANRGNLWMFVLYLDVLVLLFLEYTFYVLMLAIWIYDAGQDEMDCEA